MSVFVIWFSEREKTVEHCWTCIFICSKANKLYIPFIIL